MLTRVLNWANRLGIRIPRSFAREAGVDVGSLVDLTVKGGRIIISPVRRRRYTLGALLRRITSKNLHGAVEFGKPRGKESS